MFKICTVCIRSSFRPNEWCCLVQQYYLALCLTIALVLCCGWWLYLTWWDSFVGICTSWMLGKIYVSHMDKQIQTFLRTKNSILVMALITYVSSESEIKCVHVSHQTVLKYHLIQHMWKYSRFLPVTMSDVSLACYISACSWNLQNNHIQRFRKVEYFCSISLRLWSEIINKILWSEMPYLHLIYENKIWSYALI